MFFVCKIVGLPSVRFRSSLLLLIAKLLFFFSIFFLNIFYFFLFVLVLLSIIAIIAHFICRIGNSNFRFSGVQNVVMFINSTFHPEIITQRMYLRPWRQL